MASWCQCPVLSMRCLRTQWLLGQETQQQSGSGQRHEGAVSGQEGGWAEKQVVQAEGTLISKGSHRALTAGGHWRGEPTCTQRGADIGRPGWAL